MENANNKIVNSGCPFPPKWASFHGCLSWRLWEQTWRSSSSFSGPLVLLKYLLFHHRGFLSPSLRFLRSVYSRSLEVFLFLVLKCHLIEEIGFPGGSVMKNLPANADVGLIPGSGRSLGEGNENPLEYSCVENPMERSLAGYSP